MGVLPAHVLWVRGVGDTPVVDVEALTERGGAGLRTTLTARTPTRVKVLQDSGGRERERERERE